MNSFKAALKKIFSNRKLFKNNKELFNDNRFLILDGKIYKLESVSIFNKNHCNPNKIIIKLEYEKEE